MSEMKAANLGLLLRCYEGLRNWHALVMLVVGFVVAALLMALNAVIASKLAFDHQMLAAGMGLLLAIISLLVLLAGVNGSGLILVDQADGRASRGFGAAFFGGLGVTLQSILCLIILGVGLLVVVLVLWALSFLGHIPGIGGVFAFLLAGPTMLVLAFCYAVLAFGVALMFVALWRGNGITGSIGRALDVVLKRPLDTVLHFIVLALLIVPIGVFVAGVMFGGAALTGVMYGTGSAFGGGSSFDGGPFGGGSFGGGPLSMLMSSFGGGSMGAVMVSIGVVFVAVWALFVLIQMLGTILIFDSLAAETAAGSADFLRRKAQQMKAKVEEYRPQTPPVQAPPPAAAPRVARCVSCNAPLAPGDKFCGECGSAQS